MRPTSHPRTLAALAGALVLACGRDPSPSGASPAPIRVAPEAPLPAVGVEGDIPAASPSAAEANALARALAALPSRASVDARPSLPDPAARSAGSVEGPRLVGRSREGGEVVQFPLVHSRVVAQVTGDVARVEVTQYYANTSKARLEAVYAFPLPPNAAVTDMLFRVGKRVVASEVRRREEAKRAYEVARKEGRTAALTEQERPNLFTQSVANVPPGETVAVVLRYVHEVPFDDGRYLFHFPTTIGPRYVPAASTGEPSAGAEEDASRLTPPVVPAGQRSPHDVDILVRLVPGAAFEDVAAKSHRVVTGMDGDGARLVALSEDDRIPNKDFVLSWRPAAREPSAHALLQRDGGEQFLLLFVQPPAEVAPALVRPKELVFLLDKSGSMSGAPLDRARAVIARALEASGPDDTFQIVAFDGAAQSMTAAPLPATRENVARANAWMALLSGGGGTEMLAGIKAALGPPADPRRLRVIVFCTDGFIGNEAQVIEAVGALRGSARVFGFGIGTSVNRYLIEGVARAGRGAAEVVDLREAPDDAVARLFKRLDRPVLTDLQASFEGGEVTDLLPAQWPDLFAGQPLTVAGRVRGGAPGHVVLRGVLGERPWSSRIAIRAAAPGGSSEAAPLAEQPVAGTLWARRRVDQLLDETQTGPRSAAVEEVVATALRFKLVTRYTSFVAVERELRVDPALALARTLVPNELPEGVSREGIFGPATSVQVLPARVKPGDPELRVVAPPDAVSVKVALPFEPAAREAIRDPAKDDWVMRFLVPPTWPDGSYDAVVTIVRAGGEREERRVPIRVDTTASAVAVLSAPSRARPGEAIHLSLKPALSLAEAAGLAGRPGGLGAALKGAMEVKEVLARASWGEVVRARMEGPLGAYVAELHVPEGARAGAASVEVVASDAAGNVSRRQLALEVAPPAAARTPRAAALALTLAAGALALVLLVAGGALRSRRRSRPRPLELVLLSGSLERAERARAGRRLQGTL